MWTAGIVVFIAAWWMTQNMLIACGLMICYYAVALILGIVLHKMLFPVWLRITVQILIAACLIVALYLFAAKRELASSTDSHLSQTEPAQNKDEKVRDFALREMPSVWRAYQVMSSAIEEQGEKIAELRKTLELFGTDADSDADFRKILKMRDELSASRDAIKAKLEEAYLQARKFAASPDRKDYDELRKKAIEDGVSEAQAALRKYKSLKEQK